MFRNETRVDAPIASQLTQCCATCQITPTRRDASSLLNEQNAMHPRVSKVAQSEAGALGRLPLVRPLFRALEASSGPRTDEHASTASQVTRPCQVTGGHLWLTSRQRPLRSAVVGLGSRVLRPPSRATVLSRLIHPFRGVSIPTVSPAYVGEL